jgi:predicted dehydrogenase
VIGADGSLRWNGLTGVIDIYKPGSNGWDEYVVISHQCDDSYQAQWLDFLAAISGNKEPSVDCKVGLVVLKIVEAAKASARNNGAQQTLIMNNSDYV